MMLYTKSELISCEGSQGIEAHEVWATTNVFTIIIKNCGFYCVCI